MSNSIFDQDETIHKRTGRWTVQELVDAGLDVATANIYKNCNKILCNKKLAYFDVDPPAVATHNNKVNCKRCKNIMNSKKKKFDTQINKILLGEV